MVFPSVPLYLDPPNWQQHTNQVHLIGGGNENPQARPLAPLPPLPLLPQTGNMVGPAIAATASSSTSVSKASSMAERTRLTKIPQQGPDGGPLMCPRCESTKTKFCYFNNYSLSQPRHFCKTCRRYWTLGGALRNVPVGGGCRRNKRSSKGASSSSRSKLSPAVATEQPQGAASTEGCGISTSALINQLTGMNHDSNSNNITAPHQFSFMGSNLVNLTAQLGIRNNNLGFGARFDGRINHTGQVDFGGTQEQQHHLPLLTGFGVHPFQSEDVETTSFYGGGVGGGGHHSAIEMLMRPKMTTTTGPVKMEEISAIQLGQGSLSKQLAGEIQEEQGSRNPQFWSGNRNGNGLVATTASGLWTDLSGLN